MATLASFDDMLNDHLHYDLLREEQKERAWLIGAAEIDSTWKGGPLPVPFEGAEASSLQMGGLTAENDISEYEYVRGSVEDYKEIWGTLKFHEKDLAQHVPAKAKQKGLINKQSFLKILPGQIENFLTSMKDAVSIQLLNGPHLATLTADSTANDGVIEVDRIERLKRGMKVVVEDDDSTAIECYVKTINVNAYTAVLVTTRGGTTVVDFSAANMTTAQNAKLYIPGAQTTANQFTSLRDQLLSAANGGSANLFGQSKLEYPYLQAINVDGSSMTKTNILETIFDAWTTINNLGKGHADRVIMSYKHLGSVLKLLEAGSGGFRHISTKATPYKYKEVVVGGVHGDLTLVGIWEMDDDIMPFLDMSAFKLHTNEMFERHIDPNGNGYYTVRATTGYYYVVDVRFYGDLILHAPSRCGIIYGISYA